MTFVEQKVSHKVFGVGIIKEQTDSTINIDFDGEIKTFQFPVAFEKYLKFVDDTDNQIIIDILKEKEFQKQIETEKARKLNEEQIIAQKIKQYNESSKRKIETYNIPCCENSTQFRNLCVKTINSEMAYLKNNGSKKYRLFDGTKINTKDNKNIYTFETDSELHFPDGTQIIILKNGNKFSGKIIACEEYNVIIDSSIDLGIDISQLEFSAEPWQLLDALNKRIEEIMENPSKIVNSLITDGNKEINRVEKICVGQENAIAKATTQPITFIWGPPGTGKTFTLAKIALEHIKKGNRVLMVSFSNVSVDGAINRIFDMNSTFRPGAIVRYGYPRDTKLLSHEYLTSYNLAIHNHPELLKERIDLKNEQKKLMSKNERYLQIEKRLKQIRDTLSLEEKEIVRSAQFVATTVSKTFIDKELYEQMFDVVIVDEASMAYIPQVVFVASLAKTHFCCIGDFCQLPPIVQNENSAFLKTDIFHYAGVFSAVDNKFGHNWLVMLNVQRRMHPHISDFSSRHMYENLILSASNMENERSHLVALYPFKDNALGLIDLSGMMSVCTQLIDSSRINVLSAFISLKLAMIYAQKAEIGIITPYNAQSRLICSMIRDVMECNNSINSIASATVHKFQGSEKDVILYDAVDCYRMPYPGLLLTSKDNNNANRLFNVALTRAKGKFVALTNVDYMKNKNLSETLMYSKLLKQFDNKNILNGDGLLDVFQKNSNNNFGFYNESEGTSKFFSDIENAKSEIRIDIPEQVENNAAYISRLDTLIHQAKSKGVKVYLRVENKLSFPKELLSYAVENKYITNPITIIDKKIIWFGQPLSQANFVSSDIVIKTRFRPIIRFEGKHTAKSLYGFLEMSRTVDQALYTKESNEEDVNNFASYVSLKKICPKCNSPMKLNKSKSGKFFIGCSEYPKCESTEWISKDFVHKYLYNKSKSGIRCPRDNMSLEVKLGRFGIYIKCCALNSHTFKLDEI